MNTVPPHSLNMLVRKLESVSQLSGEERQAVEQLPVKVRILQPDQDIERFGDHPSHCCLILDGWKARYKDLSEGRRQIMSFHVAGDISDLQSFYLHVMHHSLCAMSPCTVALISYDSLRTLVARLPPIEAALWRDNLVDAAIFREWMVGIRQRSARSRIAHLFCEMYLKLDAVGLAHSHSVNRPITQIDIGHALGLSNVHVNRALQDLRGQGLIILEKRTLTISNWQALCEKAEFDPVYLHLEGRAAWKRRCRDDAEILKSRTIGIHHKLIYSDIL